MYRIYIILFLVATSFACDRRERILEITPDYEGERIAVLGYLTSGEYLKLEVARTLPIGPDTRNVSAELPEAQAEIWKDGSPWQTLYYVTDTMKIYDFGQLPDGSIDTFRVTVTGVNSYFLSTEPLILEQGSRYQLRVSALGYPDLVSKSLEFKNRATIEEVTAAPADMSNISRLNFPSIQTLIRLTDTDKYVFGISYFPWYQMPVSTPFEPRASATYSLEVDGELQQTVQTNQQNVMVNHLYVQDTAICPAGCFLPPDGAILVLETLDKDIIDYRASVLNNSEYQGGFLPPNPYIAHNVSGGYGLFAILEKDSVIIVR